MLRGLWGQFVFSCAVALVTLAGAGVAADHHLMQIEQVIGGVNGDTSAQAIQLRMRFGLQNNLSPSRIRAFDADGQNPVVIIDFTSSVPNGDAGDRVLITTAAFDALTTPVAEADFTMTNAIPQSYLAAGSLVFENDGGTVWWRLSFGGFSYEGSTEGDLTNDDDGDFGPPCIGGLPTTGRSAFQFQGSAGDMSTTNVDDYALTTGAATFINNAGDSFSLDEGDPPVEASVRSFTVQTGTHVSGNTADLRDSDNEFLKIDAAFLQGEEPPYVMIVEVKLKTTEVDLTNLSILVESKLNKNGGTAKLYLRNWQQGGWTLIANDAIGKTEATRTVNGLSPAKYVNESDIIKLRIRHHMTTSSFRSLIDHVQALVQ